MKGYRNNDRLEEPFEALVGGRIEDAFVDEDGTPILLLARSNGPDLVLAIEQDPEGNGPGFIRGFENRPDLVGGDGVLQEAAERRRFA